MNVATRTSCIADLTRRSHWDRRAEHYGRQFDLSPIRRQILEETRRRLPNQACRVTDLGGGFGHLIEHLLPFYPDAEFHLVDLSAEMLVRARARLERHGNVRFHESTVESLPFADASIDLVVSNFALHHLSDDAKLVAASEISRVLQCDGVAVIADEILFDRRVVNDSIALRERMFELFYPGVDREQLMKTFSDFEEWPIDPVTEIKILGAAGLDATIEPFNDLIGFIIARPSKSA